MTSQVYWLVGSYLYKTKSKGEASVYIVIHSLLKKKEILNITWSINVLKFTESMQLNIFLSISLNCQEAAKFLYIVI